MPQSLNIIVTCTQRKAAVALPQLRAAKLTAKTARGRATEWTTKVDRQSATPRKALDLYAGDTWSVVRSILRDAPTVGIRPVLWICSAGYGLVRHVTQVLPYAATFSRSEPDSVTRDHDRETPREQGQTWWEHLTRWQGPEAGQPRSIAALARKHRQTPILFAGSQAYFEPMHQDLAEAAQELANPDLLSLISAGTDGLNGLSKNLLPCDARYQLMLGGARQSLNARLLHMLLVNHTEEFTASSLTETLMETEENLEDLPTYERATASDDDVREFLKVSLKANPKAKHTPLLREFRDSGFRCEQTRFKNLFKTAQAEIHGN